MRMSAITYRMAVWAVFLWLSCGCISLRQAILTEEPGLVRTALLYSSPTEKDALGRPAIFQVAYGGNLQIAGLLISAGADVNTKFMGRTPLHVAAEGGYKAMVQFLIEKGADVLAKDRDGNTPLHDAALSGRGRVYVEVASLLLDHGVIIDAINKNGKTALDVAAWSNNRDMVEFLLWKGARVKVGRSTFCRALFAAAGNERVDIAELLLDAKADVNGRNELGETALHEAVSKGNRAMAVFLLSHGADVNAKDSNGQTPLDVVDHPEKRLPNISRAFDWPSSSPPANAFTKEIRKILLDHGAKQGTDDSVQKLRPSETRPAASGVEHRASEH